MRSDEPELQVQPEPGLLQPASHPARSPELTVRFFTVCFLSWRDEEFFLLFIWNLSLWTDRLSLDGRSVGCRATSFVTVISLPPVAQTGDLSSS
jgi:hypothetical protein